MENTKTLTDPFYFSLSVCFTFVNKFKAIIQPIGGIMIQYFTVMLLLNILPVNVLFEVPETNLWSRHCWKNQAEKGILRQT